MRENASLEGSIEAQSYHWNIQPLQRKLPYKAIASQPKSQHRLICCLKSTAFAQLTKNAQPRAILRERVAEERAVGIRKGSERKE